MYMPALPNYLKRCYFCDNAWGECTCKFQPASDERGVQTDAPGFVWNDEFFITDPGRSCCSRFHVDPVKEYGAAYLKFAKEHPDLCKRKLA